MTNNVILPLQEVVPIPTLDRRPYLTEVIIPDAYLDELVREFVRHDFNGGVPMEFWEPSDFDAFKSYVRDTTFGRFKLSLASYITSHPLGSPLAEIEGVNLRSEVVFRLSDAFSVLPGVSKLYSLLVRMFPIVRLHTGEEHLPLIPTRSDIEDHYARAVDLYNGNSRVAAMLANTLSPIPMLSVSMAGYPVLCGLAQTPGDLLFVQDFNDLTSIGWPYVWSNPRPGSPTLEQLSARLHFSPGYLLPGRLEFNIQAQGRNDASVIVGGKIRGSRFGKGLPQAMATPTGNRTPSPSDADPIAGIDATAGPESSGFNRMSRKGKGGKS